MYNNWDKWYKIILDDFSFKEEDDIESARYLNEKVSKFDMSHIDFKHQCIVFGAGPSIKKHIAYLKRNVNLKDYTLIAADGTTKALLEESIVPDIIVTDLDGDIESIFKSNKLGSILYVHAHGDNLDKLKSYLDELNKVVPTCQCRSFGNLENYGGFTDGDRAVHIAVYALKVEKIILAGMDFGNIITNYSRPEIGVEFKVADSFKKKKLCYAKKLIDNLKKENFQIEFINLCDSI
ncbi:MAG: DUF115 domain-containing protein [Methanosphaera stadtmanae]|nr:DUF115 domain-containing protein [Methanosphaera stadtmanae]